MGLSYPSSVSARGFAARMAISSVMRCCTASGGSAPMGGSSSPGCSGAQASSSCAR